MCLSFHTDSLQVLSSWLTSKSLRFSFPTNPQSSTQFLHWLHNRLLVRELNPSKSYHPSRILVVALHTDQSSLHFSPLKGIYKQPFANTLLNSGFFASLSKSVNDTWEEKHQENVKEFFKQSLENNIAKPVVRMLRYLTTCFYAFYILETIYN